MASKSLPYKSPNIPKGSQAIGGKTEMIPTSGLMTGDRKVSTVRP